MQGKAGLIEMLLFFALVLGWAGWQVWDYRKWKRQQRQEEAERREASPPAAAPPPPPPVE